MSRNKVVLLIILLVGIYFAIPNSDVGLIVKENMIRVSAYLLLLAFIYAVISLNILKTAMRKLASNVNDENASKVVKLLRITFDVKRMFGVATLQSLYNQVNTSKSVSANLKEEFYEAMKRKGVNVPLPSKSNNHIHKKNKK